MYLIMLSRHKFKMGVRREVMVREGDSWGPGPVGGSLELWGNWDRLVLTNHFLFLLGKMSRTYRFSFSILGSDGSYELFFKTIFFLVQFKVHRKIEGMVP